ncbi:MAG TPA: hypothetical protein VFO40_11715 [Chthoniobacterales bacterium]|nr:hypothetical protein [Chthoniobacterales bacterium]
MSIDNESHLQVKLFPPAQIDRLIDLFSLKPTASDGVTDTARYTL